MRLKKCLQRQHSPELIGMIRDPGGVLGCDGRIEGRCRHDVQLRRWVSLAERSNGLSCQTVNNTKDVSVLAVKLSFFTHCQKESKPALNAERYVLGKK